MAYLLPLLQHHPYHQAHYLVYHFIQLPWQSTVTRTHFIQLYLEILLDKMGPGHSGLPRQLDKMVYKIMGLVVGVILSQSQS